MRIDIISAFTILIPLITAGIAYKHLNKTLKKLSVFILFSACTEVLAAFYSMNGWYNMSISHLYAFIQVPLIAWLFHDILKGISRKAVIYLTIGYLLFSVISLIFWEDLDQFNSNQRYAAAICLFFFCALYYIQIFIDTKIMRIELDPYFWISASVLIYIAGTLFLFIYANELIASGKFDYWYLNNILNIFLNLGLTLSLWMGMRKSK